MLGSSCGSEGGRWILLVGGAQRPDIGRNKFVKGRVDRSRFIESDFLGCARFRDKKAGRCAPDSVAIAEKEIIVSKDLRIRGSKKYGIGSRDQLGWFYLFHRAESQGGRSIGHSLSSRGVVEGNETIIVELLVLHAVGPRRRRHFLSLQMGRRGISGSNN